LEAISGWADNFSDDKWSFPRGRELVHAIGLLDAPEDEVTNIEECFLNIAVVISSKLLVVVGLPHDSSKPLLFKAIEVDTTGLLCFFFFVELYAWSSEGDVGRQYGFRSIDQKEGQKSCGGADLSPLPLNHVW
jgi:hypothetical protein